MAGSSSWGPRARSPQTSQQPLCQPLTHTTSAESLHMLPARWQPPFRKPRTPLPRSAPLPALSPQSPAWSWAPLPSAINPRCHQLKVWSSRGHEGPKPSQSHLFNPSSKAFLNLSHRPLLHSPSQQDTCLRHLPCPAPALPCTCPALHLPRTQSTCPARRHLPEDTPWSLILVPVFPTTWRRGHGTPGPAHICSARGLDSNGQRQGDGAHSA